VTFGFACPSWRETKTMFSPFAISSEANECRRLWKGELPRRLQPCPLDGLPEALSHVPVVEPAPQRVAEHEVSRVLVAVAAGEPVLAQAPDERRGEDHIPPSRHGLELRVLARAGELPVNADQPVLEVDVRPGEAQRLADPQAGVGEKLEQHPAGAGMFEEEDDLLAFEDRSGHGVEKGAFPSTFVLGASRCQ
jgi:hypothetical protein